MLIWVAIISFLIVIIWSLIIILPKGGSREGDLVGGHLAPCPSTPNCVCSEIKIDSSAYITPLKFKGDASTAWAGLKQVIIKTGGQVEAGNDDYRWAVYTTRWLRFVDDVEFRLEPNQGLIHIRSISRLGYSDFSVNRKRIEYIRALFIEQMNNNR